MRLELLRAAPKQALPPFGALYRLLAAYNPAKLRSHQSVVETVLLRYLDDQEFSCYPQKPTWRPRENCCQEIAQSSSLHIVRAG